MALPIIVIGAGGHAKVIISALLLLKRQIIGITEADEKKRKNSLYGIPVIGGDDTILQYKPQDIELANGLGSVGLPEKRREVFNAWKKHGYHFTCVIHPASILASDIIIGEGTQIMAGAIIQPGCRIGDDAIVNTRAVLDHDCIIGEHTHIAPGAVLSGNAHVGVASHVGTSATVIQGVEIGESVVIGAGAVVIQNIPVGSKAMGVPARIVK